MLPAAFTTHGSPLGPTAIWVPPPLIELHPEPSSGTECRRFRSPTPCRRRRCRRRWRPRHRLPAGPLPSEDRVAIVHDPGTTGGIDGDAHRAAGDGLPCRARPAEDLAATGDRVPADRPQHPVRADPDVGDVPRERGPGRGRWPLDEGNLSHFRRQDRRGSRRRRRDWSRSCRRRCCGHRRRRRRGDPPARSSAGTALPARAMTMVPKGPAVIRSPAAVSSTTVHCGGSSRKSLPPGEPTMYAVPSAATEMSFA